GVLAREADGLDDVSGVRRPNDELRLAVGAAPDRARLVVSHVVGGDDLSVHGCTQVVDRRLAHDAPLAPPAMEPRRTPSMSMGTLPRRHPTAKTFSEPCGFVVR